MNLSSCTAENTMLLYDEENGLQYDITFFV